MEAVWVILVFVWSVLWLLVYLAGFVLALRGSRSWAVPTTLVLSTAALVAPEFTLLGPWYAKALVVAGAIWVSARSAFRVRNEPPIPLA